MDYDRDHVILKNPSWWERRTNLERRAMVVTFLLFLLTIILIIGLAVILLYDYQETEEYFHLPPGYDYAPEPIRDGRQEQEHICLSSGCIHAASRVMKYMDQSVNPCDDFYHFSCGGFLNETNIPAELDSVNAFTFNFELLEDQLRTVVEEQPKAKEAKPFALLKKLYNKCMDTPSIDAHGLKTIKTILRNLGGWPVLDGYDWDEHQFDWKQTIFKFRRAGLSENYLLRLGVSLDFHNASRYMLELDQPDLGIEAEFLARGIEDEKVKAYFSYMADTAALLGVEMPFALTELKAVLEFEVALARFSVNKNDVWNTTSLYNPVRISELQRRHPSISWLEYINGAIDLNQDFVISYEEVVIVRVPEYLQNFENLLRWTSKRILANYLMWRAVKYSINYLTTELRDRQDVYYKTIFNMSERPSRWEECIITVSTRMPYVIGSLYVQKYIDSDAQQIIYEMVANIRNQFIKMIGVVDWMDEFTRMKALNRAESMSVYTAFSDDSLSTKKLQKYYTQLELPRDNYLSYILSVDIFERDKYYRKLRQYIGAADYNTDEYMISLGPAYSPFENTLNIPNAILKSLFFGSDRLQYLNYGALGYIIAHEIVHGFDDTGKKYDRDGNSFDWWSEHTKRNFLKKAQCINTQYRNYTAPEIEVFLSGINKHETNIANQGGVKAAYFAYILWVEQNGQEYLLPSLKHFSPQQLFWISAAQTHCEKYRPEYLKSMGYTERKSPAYYDVHETFSNVEFFSRDFQCSYGTSMNPMNKCYVW